MLQRVQEFSYSGKISHMPLVCRLLARLLAVGCLLEYSCCAAPLKARFVKMHTTKSKKMSIMIWPLIDSPGGDLWI